MALKDWKKTSENTDDIIYDKKRDFIMGGRSHRLFILKPSSAFTHTLDFVVRVYEGVHNKINQTFKTKSQALAFAKQYMRTH